MKKNIIDCLEAIAGVIVFALVFIVGVVYTTGKHIWKWDYSFSKQFKPIAKSVLLIFDGLANAGGGEMLNDKFNVTGKIRFGNWYQTISAITGLLFLHVKEIALFSFLNKTLGKNHCVDAISEEDLFYYENKKELNI